MKFGLFGGALTGNGLSSDSQSYGHFIDYIREADSLGFHSAFVVEHHFTGVGQVSATLGLLTYLAAKTERIRLGTGVLVLPWHNPVLLAEQVATLDLLSGGRADIGVGKGYRPGEFGGFDIPIEEAAERYEENLAVLVKSLSSTERFTHKGKRWSFKDIIVEPQSIQRPHPPIWVGATSAPSIQRAARDGFNLLLDHGAPNEAIVERLQVYREAVAECGRAYVPGQAAVARAIKVAKTPEERDAFIAGRAKFLMDVGAVKSGAAGPGLALAGLSPEASTKEIAWARAAQAVIAGTPDEVIAKLKELETQGVHYVLLTDTGSSLDTLQDFARDVMPAFASEKVVA